MIYRKRDMYNGKWLALAVTKCVISGGGINE